MAFKVVRQVEDRDVLLRRHGELAHA
jgi:hypothetical protein